jgi:hypothetical protein
MRTIMKNKHFAAFVGLVVVILVYEHRRINRAWGALDRTVNVVADLQEVLYQGAIDDRFEEIVENLEE